MRLATSLLLAIVLSGVLAWGDPQSGRPRTGVRQRTYTYTIDKGTPDSEFKPGDRELATWALQDWERHADGRMRFVQATAGVPRIRLKFVGPLTGEYGETQRERVGNRLVSVVYVRPDTSALGPTMSGATRTDPLLREAVVYLTCLHELGHALGLAHTSDERDIMYSFQFGGDVHAFFSRYRDQLARRSDIAKTSGLSAGDVAQLRASFRPR